MDGSLTWQQNLDCTQTFTPRKSASLLALVRRCANPAPPAHQRPKRSKSRPRRPRKASDVNHATMCSMKRLDLIGFRKGRLTVTDFSHSHIQPSGQKRAIWKAICDCGVEKLISTSNLTHGNTVSCGCKLREGNRKKDYGEASFNHKYNSYEARARTHKKKLVFELTKDQFRTLVAAPCHYCGAVGSCNTKARPTSNGAFTSNGIDRLDSSVGYVLSNCVSCCKICNLMKNDLAYDQFFLHLKRILSHASCKKC